MRFIPPKSIKSINSFFATASMVLVISAATGCSQNAVSPSDQSVDQVQSGNQSVSDIKPIQVGWMTSWSTCGQLIQALVHTNISKLYEVPLIFRSFLFGPDINEAALHGEVDCVNVGLVPAITLVAASKDWVVVGKLLDSPVEVIARRGTKIKTIADLKGKSIAVPFGAGTHPYVLQLLEEAKLPIGEEDNEVKLVNLKPSEQAIAMEQGSVDAVGTWEPQTAMILTRKLGEIIDRRKQVGVIIVRKSIADKQPERIVNLLKAYIAANYYVATHKDQADHWFEEAAHLDDAVVKAVKIIEPNLSAQKIQNVDINLKPADIALIQGYADTMYKNDLIAVPVKFEDRVNLSFLQQAMKELAEQGDKAAEIKAIPVVKD